MTGSIRGNVGYGDMNPEQVGKYWVMEILKLTIIQEESVIPIHLSVSLVVMDVIGKE